MGNDKGGGGVQPTPFSFVQPWLGAKNNDTTGSLCLHKTIFACGRLHEHDTEEEAQLYGLLMGNVYLWDIQNANTEHCGAFWKFLQFSLGCVEVRRAPAIEGWGLEKHVLEGIQMGTAGFLGPSKGLEGKIGHDIILCRLLQIGNLGTKLVT